MNSANIQYLESKSLVVTCPALPRSLSLNVFRAWPLGSRTESKRPQIHSPTFNWASPSLELLTDPVPPAQGAESGEVCKPRGGCCLRKTCFVTVCPPPPSLPLGPGAHRRPWHCLCLAGGSPWVPTAASLGGDTSSLSVAGTVLPARCPPRPQSQ